ncbi:MAG: acylphosphatase [Verrucomicrobiae bacterium]|nr:acylphosphatase [Verrucomicrobiae bacterium]
MTQRVQEKAARVFFSGRVQGVGFRYSCREVAKGFDVIGWVRNLDDGRVELWAQGGEAEVRDFLQAIDESHLKGLITQSSVSWSSPEDGLKGFAIVH